MASKYAIHKETEFKISEEAATAQVVDFLTYYDIDPDRLSQTEGDLSKAEEMATKSLERTLDHLRDAIRAGRVEVERDKDGKMVVTQHLTGGDSLVYPELRARHKITMEKFDPEASHSRIYALMGALASVGDAGIKKLPTKDLSLVEVLGGLFILA